CSPPMLLPNSCSAAAHQRVHQGSPPHVCPECGGTAKQQLLQKHLQETCLHFSRRIGYSLVARKRRRAAVKMEDGEATDGKSPVKKLRSSSSAPYTPPESGFSCAPCGFTTEDSPAFLEHISQHRRGGTEGGGLQCLQCGACFTSTSSLSRHRFIIHKVKDAFSESQQILSVPLSPSAGNIKNHDDRSSLNGSEPASPSSQSLASQGKEEDGPLACKVCGKHFEKATDLNTHFRTHGMAFIIARNAGKTT
ncbi:hypothetical protein XENOCAPTIV_013412, partial [Xenoophorus captivus]